MKNFLIGLFTIIVLGITGLINCGPPSPYTTMDAYCLDECKTRHNDVVGAEWHGNDEYLKKTRCGCLLDDKENGIYTYVHLFPYKEYQP